MRTNELARELRSCSEILSGRPNGYGITELMQRDAGGLMAEAAGRLEGALDALVDAERSSSGAVIVPDRGGLTTDEGERRLRQERQGRRDSGAILHPYWQS